MSLLIDISNALESNPDAIIVSTQRLNIVDRLKEIERESDEDREDIVCDIVYNKFLDRWNFNIAPLGEQTFEGYETCLEFLKRLNILQLGEYRMELHHYRPTGPLLFFGEQIAKAGIELRVSSPDLAKFPNSEAIVTTNIELQRYIAVRVFPNVAMALMCPPGCSLDGSPSHDMGFYVAPSSISREAIEYYRGATIGFLYDESKPESRDKLGVVIKHKCPPITRGQINPLRYLDRMEWLGFIKIAGIEAQDVDKPIGYLKDKLVAWVERAKG